MNCGYHTIRLTSLLGQHKWGVVALFLSQAVVASLLVIGQFKLCLILAGALVFLLAVTDFELSVHILIVSFFIDYFFLPGWGIKLADFALLAVFVAFFGRQALSGQSPFRATPMDRSILLLVLALTISLVNVVDLFAAAKSYLRHLEMLALFYVLSAGIKRESITKFLRLFLTLAVLHSCQTLFLFVARDGGRSFGVAGVPFANILVVALLVNFAFYLLQEDYRRRVALAFVFLILLGALTAIQTRSALLYFVAGYVVVSLLAYAKSRTENLRYIRHNLFSATALIVTVGVAIVMLQPSIISAFAHRLETVFLGSVGTVKLRLVLWSVALKGFFHSPFLGVGLGQFDRMRTIVPEVRFIPLYEYVEGMSAHSLFFSFLAETGFFGILCLSYFMFCFVKLAWVAYRQASGRTDLLICLAIWGGLLGGQWSFWSVTGMIFMFFLALLVVLRRRQARLKARQG